MLQFNLSHSDRFALYAFARERAIGIDIEYIRPIPEAEQIAEAFFSAYERAVFRSIPAHKKAEAFFNCWTRKEAYIKAIGDGFARPLDRFDVSFAPGEQARLLNVEEDLDEPSRWSFHELVPVPGYVATLVVEGHGGSLACWQWQQ